MWRGEDEEVEVVARLKRKPISGHDNISIDIYNYEIFDVFLLKFPKVRSHNLSSN